MQSRSNLCHSSVTSTYYASKKYLNNLTFKIPKTDFSNPAKLSGSGEIFAGAGSAGFGKSAGFQPEPESGTTLMNTNVVKHTNYK